MKQINLYKRNSIGNPILWYIAQDDKIITTESGLVLGASFRRSSSYPNEETAIKEFNSKVAKKRKEGYKEVHELYDNAPDESKISTLDLNNYLNTYLPKFNVSDNGNILPMLAKTLENNNPFNKNTYRGQWKINGLRCLIGAFKADGLFTNYKLTFQSREGTHWSLPHLEDILMNLLDKHIIDFLISSGAKLDGEIYLPGYNINDINSFVKNPSMPQHKALQFWCYDIAVEDICYINRRELLLNSMSNHLAVINSKNDHLNNRNNLILLPEKAVWDINSATIQRDAYIDLGFEGLIVRNIEADYGFDARNNNMLKYKKIYDGLFEILDIVPEGKKRATLPKFICKNDINGNTFETTIIGTFEQQEQYLINKDKYTNGEYLCLVEFRERSGVNELPFHAKGVKIILKNAIK